MPPRRKQRHIPGSLGSTSPGHKLALLQHNSTPTGRHLPILISTYEYEYEYKCSYLSVLLGSRVRRRRAEPVVRGAPLARASVVLVARNNGLSAGVDNLI